jgi:hypothetical protein
MDIRKAYRTVALVVSNNLAELDAKYTKEQVIHACRCEYIRYLARVLGEVSWIESIRFVRSRLVTNSLKEANEVLYALGIRN